MLGWAIRLLFVVAGFIASFFVARDALNFGVVQVMIAVLLFTTLVGIITFWPVIRDWTRHIFKK